MSLFRDGYAWADVDTYADAIAARSKLRGWGIKRKAIETSLSGIRQHKDVLHPTAIRMFLGRGAGYDWAEASAWMTDALNEHDSKYFDDNGSYAETRKGQDLFHYASRSGPKSETESELTPSYLNLERYHFKDPAIWGVLGVMDVIRKGSLGRLNGWPGLDLLWLFALNPEMYLRGWDRWTQYSTLLLPGIVLTDEGGDKEALNCGASTGWGSIPLLENSGPVIRSCHRSSSASSGMCFVGYV